MITPENIVRHELIGLRIEVADSKNSKSAGIKGKVIDETRNTLKIEKEDGKEATLIKEDCVFLFTLPDRRRVRVEGEVIVARPEDRIKKRFRKW